MRDRRSPVPPHLQKIRLNKYLADAGVASRRKADELIARGAVRVDGKRAATGQFVDPAGNVVTVDGKPIQIASTAHATYALNKPAGVVTTMRDDRGRPSIAQLLPRGRRIFPIGRLDAETTGLLICTSDGDLAHALAHPSSEIPRAYRVTVSGSVTPSSARSLQARNLKRNRDGSTTFDMVLHEGKNRQVRRSCAQAGLRVVQLTRIAFGPLCLGDLKPGVIRALTRSEHAQLERLLKGR
jgi:23S rRNA pseudouridine2605 synthase